LVSRKAADRILGRQRPVHPGYVLPLGDVVATVLLRLEGHAGHPGAGEGSSRYSGLASGATSRIRATTPLGVDADTGRIVAAALTDKDADDGA
jgi:hypothetical protein